MTAHSNPPARKSASRQKPAKPYPDFPLFPHANGLWAKKIRGRLHYFGPWRDPDAALQKYLDQKDDLHAGRTPHKSGDGLTIRDLCNRFLNAKRQLVDSGELRKRTWEDYYVVCRRLISTFGGNRLVDDLAADDFARMRADFAEGRGPVTVLNFIVRIRVIFKFAVDNALIDRPVRYGTRFNRPSARVLRKAQAGNGPRTFERDEILAMLDAAGMPLRAMILLGVNCGYGNADCGTLPLSAVDLDRGWIDFPRPKTGVPRRCPLWPETIEALREAIATRPHPKNPDHDHLMFVTKRGLSWAKETSDNPVAKEFAKLLDRLGLRLHGRGFYGLRRTFEKIGGDARDQVAVDLVMGHAPAANDMGAVYRQRISDERLKAVIDHVRVWLFAMEREQV